MGNTFSETDYRTALDTFHSQDLSEEDLENVKAFFQMTGHSEHVEDYITNEDAKKIKEERPMNMIYIIRSAINYLNEIVSEKRIIDEKEVH